MSSTRLLKIVKNKKAFDVFNAKKKELFYNDLKESLHDLVETLPYLVSHNHKSLPGFVEDFNFNQGITFYHPTEHVAKKLFSKYRYTIPTEEMVYPSTEAWIKMFSIMGSVSTVAYNKDSDFDFWICFFSNETAEGHLKKFKEKLNILSQLFEKQYQIPVHFYLNEISGLRENIFGEEEGGGFSTTVGALLKDEYFRSSILLAGKVPFWWVVPVGIDYEEYTRYWEIATKNGMEDFYVDIGHLRVDDKAEFLGAAFFQIIKSFENPFKSIYKIGLLDKYILSQETTLLSDNLKNQVHKGLPSMNTIDSYLYLFHTVYRYFKEEHNHGELIHLLEESIYLKASPGLSRFKTHRKNRKLETFSQLTSDWGWTKEKIEYVDHFERWSLEEMQSTWNKLKYFILLIYKRIVASVPKDLSKSRLSQDDLLLIKRKIESVFAQRPGKINKWFPFKEQSYEKLLYFSEIDQSAQARSPWAVHKNVYTEKQQVKKVLLHKDDSLIRLLVWTVVNKVYELNKSSLKVMQNYFRVDTVRVQSLLVHLSKVFHFHGFKSKNSDMIESPFITRAFAVFNFFYQDSKQVREIHFVFKTSWDESYVETYSQESDILKIIQLFMRFRNAQKPMPGHLFECMDNLKKAGEKSSFVLSELADFYGAKENQKKFFLFTLNSLYVLVCPTNEKKVQLFKERSKCLSVLTKEKGEIDWQVCSKDLDFSVLHAIHKSKDTVNHQVFVSTDGKQATVHLYLNTGHIYEFNLRETNLDHFIQSFFFFLFNLLKNHIRDQNFANLFEKLRIHEVIKSGGGKYVIKQKDKFFYKSFDSFLPENAYFLKVSQKDLGTVFHTQGVTGEAQSFGTGELGQLFKEVYPKFQRKLLFSPFPLDLQSDDSVEIHQRVYHYAQVFSGFKLASEKIFNQAI